MPFWIEILFLLLSLVLGALPLYLLRRYDIHDPEPFPILIGSALVGGFVSSAFALLVFSGIEFAGIVIKPASLHSFFFIGPVEEAGPGHGVQTAIGGRVGGQTVDIAECRGGHGHLLPGFALVAAAVARFSFDWRRVAG